MALSANQINVLLTRLSLSNAYLVYINFGDECWRRNVLLTDLITKISYISISQSSGTGESKMSPRSKFRQQNPKIIRYLTPQMGP